MAMSLWGLSLCIMYRSSSVVMVYDKVIATIFALYCVKVILRFQGP